MDSSFFHQSWFILVYSLNFVLISLTFFLNALHIRESFLTQSSSVSGVCAETEAGGGKGDPGSDHPLPLQPDQGHTGQAGECRPIRLTNQRP